MGLAKAFNESVRKANSETVVLMADDLKVDPSIQEYFNIKPSEFAMLETGDFPINGVHVFNRSLFWKIGGFNEKYNYGSVDNEFYARAVLKGLCYKPIPLTLVKHVKHEVRASTIYKLFNVLSDRANFIITYLRYYPIQVLKHDFLNRLYRGQALTVYLNIVFFFKTLFKNKLSEWDNILKEEYP
jgi:predicted glycosyltransferase involved in capsule biosynthesis